MRRRSFAALPLLLCLAAAASAEPKSGKLLAAVPTNTVTAEEIRSLSTFFFEEYGASRAELPVSAFHLEYASTDADGTDARISAQLFVPLYASAVKRPILVFASGTTGVADQCAPSLEQPQIRRWGWYRANMLSYAGEGFITIFPDYLGFNDPGRSQRYFSKEAEAHVVLDAVRAVYGFFRKSSLKVSPAKIVFAAGYSQGGHAAFAAADLRPRYAPEVPLTGVIGFGCTADITVLLREGPAYAPYILYSYSQIYGRQEIDPALYLQDQWLSSLEADVNRMCVDEFQVYYPSDGRRLYRPEFYQALQENSLAASFPRLHARLSENRSGLSGHGLPALIVQGLADIVVTTDSQTRFVQELCQAGSPVRYVKLPGVRHRYTRPAGFQLSVEWMESLFRGEKPASDCAFPAR